MAGHQEQLASVPLFAKLPEKALERLDRIAVQREYPAGAEIVKEGESGIGFFLITGGSAEVVAGQSALNMLKRGDYFGEMALLDGHPRSATVRAAEPTTCLVLTRWDFLAEVRQNGDIAVDLLEALSLRIRDLEARLEQAEGRVKA